MPTTWLNGRRSCPGPRRTCSDGGFFLEGSALPDRIADPSHAHELDDIYVRGIPDELRRLWEDEGLGDPPYAITVDHRVIEWDIYMSYCVPAAEVAVEPYPG
jgi:hypothetical protein